MVDAMRDSKENPNGWMNVKCKKKTSKKSNEWMKWAGKKMQQKRRPFEHEMRLRARVLLVCSPIDAWVAKMAWIKKEQRKNRHLINHNLPWNELNFASANFLNFFFLCTSRHFSLRIFSLVLVNFWSNACVIHAHFAFDCIAGSRIFSFSFASFQSTTTN